MFSSVNTCWTLVGAFLVYFMQAGFALCEAGFTRAKNTGNILMKNMMDFCIGTPCYWLIGFGLMFGGTGALIGGFDPFIQGDYSASGPRHPAVGVHRVPDRLLRNGSHHRLRLHGRAHQLQSLLRLLRSHFAGGLPHLRPLDVGRRLAPEHGLPRLCRFYSSPQRRRRHRHAGRGPAGSPHRQVRQGRQAPRHPRPQPDRRCAGRVHPLVLLVRLQRRLFPEPFHR